MYIKITCTLALLQVNTNGLLSFGEPRPDYTSEPFPLTGPKLIAPFYADVGANYSGEISYRISSSAADVSSAVLAIQDAFTDARDFTATSVFIAMWSSIGYIGSDSLVS